MRVLEKALLCFTLYNIDCSLCRTIFSSFSLFEIISVVLPENSEFWPTLLILLVLLPFLT